MSGTPESVFEALQEGTLLGPEHHRFKLLKFSTDHPLGQLWQAEDIGVSGSPLVTLLILNPALLKQNSFVEGVKKHATLSKQLQNKHIAECYGFFSHKGGLLFLSYEKLDGLTLGSMLSRGNSLQESQQLGLIRQIAYAIDMGFQKLRSAHGCLETGLIYINRRGGVKLTLFAMRDSMEAIVPLLKQPPGYKQYQAPEAFHPGKLSRKADVYSFAGIIYELLSGKAPFKAEDSEADRVRRQLEQPDALDDEQWKTLQKALATDPEERFPNCTELVKALFPPPSEEEEQAAGNSAEADTGNDADSNTEAATESDEGPARLSLKDKLARLRLPEIPRVALYSIIGSLLFVLGYLLGWFVSDFMNFKEKDFQALQIQKQQDALQQMYDSLQAQQELQQEQDKKLEALNLSNTVLKQQLEIAKTKLADSEPDEPGNQIFKDQIDQGSYGPEMVLLPSGQFRMGDQSDIGDDNEKPVHVVTIAKPFALSRFEVTFAEYDRFAEATNRPLPDDEGWGRGNRPVVNVSWRDAVAYASWLKNETGHPYRLPSEAEWEYAARAGNLTTYWWGNELKPGMANCAGCGSEWDGKQTAPVGSFPANTWGLHDMTGNVEEWVADCYEDNYNLAPLDGSAYRKRACAHRVMRGGSWFEIDRLIRPASRYRHPVDSKRNSWGFRVALDIE
ncbi:SUMF1/EgtB/PvdO family nonheme iron enzyme [Neptuniibacter halophilus]|uniref:SUMF1/EgtB/PvdO family nonheme iron enzyme n=1 Tax=Neptuniibacter halophilus TaxID=651666 RepID=UPI002572769B|nr:SUMF1/EgtB/PvdO family nonheme iron enzyme [Neptuniibacter halophilus]